METTPREADDSRAAGRRPWRRWLAAGIGVATAGAVAWQVRAALRELSRQPQATSPAWGWLAAAVALHAAGLALLAGPWLLTGAAFGVPASWRSWRVYLASHIGKYVPGKMMVPTLRCWWLNEAPIAGVLAATAYETLLAMAAAGLVGAAALAAWGQDLPGPVLLATAVAAAGFTFASLPVVFHWLVQPLLRGGAGAAPKPVAWRRWGTGLAVAGAAWVALAASFWCAIRAAAPNAEPIQAFRWALVAAPLGTVGGFVSMLPGHLGTREWILTAALTPQLGAFPALAAAAWHRLATLAAEGLLAGLGGRRTAGAGTP